MYDISHEIEKVQRVETAEPSAVRLHPCFVCFMGDDAGKRDCAIKRMVAEGALTAQATATKPYSETEH